LTIFSSFFVGVVKQYKQPLKSPEIQVLAHANHPWTQTTLLLIRPLAIADSVCRSSELATEALAQDDDMKFDRTYPTSAIQLCLAR
jgi:hypothetical protein